MLLFFSHFILVIEFFMYLIGLCIFSIKCMGHRQILGTIGMYAYRLVESRCKWSQRKISTGLLVVPLPVFLFENWVRHSFSRPIFLSPLQIKHFREIIHFGVNWLSFLNINALWSWLSFILPLSRNDLVYILPAPLISYKPNYLELNVFYASNNKLFNLAIGISTIPSSSTLWRCDFHKISSRSVISNMATASYTRLFISKFKLNKINKIKNSVPWSQFNRSTATFPSL